MKLTYFQLETQLAKSLLPVYLISGDEPFLKQDAISQIRKAAKAKQFTERTRVILQSGYDESQLYNLLHSNSFLAEKRLFEIDCNDTLPNKDIAHILEEYATNPNPDMLLLFSMNKADAKVTKANWFKVYETLGAHVAIWPLNAEQLPQWLNHRARKYKLTFKPAAMQLLCDYVAGNLTAAAQALEKLYLLRAEQPLDEEMLRLVMNDESRFSLFDLMDFILAEDSKRVLQILQNLREDGTEPTLILWGLTRELRVLLNFIEERKNNTPIDTLLQKHRIFPRRQAHIRRFLRNVSREQCLQWLAKAASIDGLLKGSITGNVWQALEQYCLQITLKGV